MRVLYLFFLLCLLGVYAQRRPGRPEASESSDTSSPRPITRSRGRTRFSVTPEFEQASQEYEQVTKNTRKTDVPRRKTESIKPTEKRLPRPTKEHGPKGRPYEVKEVIEDVPREDSRRVNKKPRVITETRFEAANAAQTAEEVPPNLSSFATASVPESIAEETALPAQLTTIPVNAISSTEKNAEEISKSSESSDLSSSSEIPKIETELKRNQPEPTASFTKPSEPRRAPHGRASARTRGTTSHRAEEPTTPASRRTRTRPSAKPEEAPPVVSSAPSTRPNFRPGRRRAEVVAESIQEPVKTRGPSVFPAEGSHELPPRSRTGRKVSSEPERRNVQRTRSEEKRRSRGERINDAPKQTIISAPENVDSSLHRRGDSRRGGRITEPSTERSSTTRANQHVSTSTTTSNPSEKIDSNLHQRADARREGGRFTEQSTETFVNTPSSKDILTPSTSNAPEKVDLNVNRRPDIRRGRLTEPSTSRSTNKVKTANEPEPRPQRRTATRSTTQKAVDSTTEQTQRQLRGRGRSRSFLTLNEQKLEVLPLFENEPKIVAPTVSSGSSLGRRRSLNSADDIATANTKQSEVQLEVDPLNEESETATDTNIRISREESVSAEKSIRKVYKKRPTFQRSKQPRKLHRALAESKEETTEAVFIRKFRPLNSRKVPVAPSSKEEVAAKDDENTKTPKDTKPKTSNSARAKKDKEVKENAAEETIEKVEDKEETKQTVKVDKPKVSISEVVRKVSQKLPSTKGKKEKVSEELTNSEEAIAEGDNYPAPYKAAIQAKKSKKEGLGSRSTQSNELSVTKPTEASVTSSSASTTLDSSSETSAVENVVKEDEETDHKSEPESTTLTPSTKFPRPRFSLTTKLPRSTENSSESSTNKNGPNRPGLGPRKYKPAKPKPPVTTTTTTTTEGSTDEDNETAATTTPTPLQKFHARFKSSRNQKEIQITPRTAHKSRSYSPKAPKGLYSSRKLSKTTIAPDVTEETEKPQPPKFSVETAALPTKVPPVGQSVKKSSRFSARYRSDILSRSAALRTSTAGPSYIPTVPTVTPPPTSVKVEENELGMEIISFDDPVANTVPSANLISGDYLSSSPATKTDPTVDSKGAAAHTTEKPVSIIERIINSITSISTTTSPDGTTKTSTTTSGQPTKSSAILNLVSKKPKDKTVTVDLPLESASQKLTNSPNSVEYRTTEKPTTIIEKILSSLSAIRADTAPETTTVDPLQVGSNYNTVDTTLKLSSTESTSRIAQATIPMSKGSSASALPLVSSSTIILPTSTASSSSTGGSTVLDSDTSSTVLSVNDVSSTLVHTSSVTPRSIPSTTPLSSQATTTTLDPKNTFEEVVSDQILPKRTIDKLLSLLNIVSPTTSTPPPTTTKLIVVTPKLTTFVTSNTEPISTEQNATPVPTTLPTTLAATSVSSSQESTSPMIFTSTLKSAESSSNDINSVVNPLSPGEPNVSSRILEMISTISRLMGSTLSPSTTILPTTVFTSDGASAVNTLSTTPGVSTTIVGSTGTSTTTAGYESSTSEASGIPTASTGPTITSTIGGVTTTAPSGTSTVVSPTTTVGSVSISTPAGAISTSVPGVNPLAFTVTDSSSASATTQTNLPISSTLTTQTSAPISSTVGSLVTNPTTIASTIGGTSTAASLTTAQGTTSTQISVVPGSESTIPSVTPNSVTSTVASNTQSASTLLTTVNTTPTSPSTTSGAITMSPTSPQTEAISASTGTTGPSIITSTTKFTRETTTDSTFDVPTTLPTLANFEVSPDRVSIYSANDISSTFVPDDPVSTTVSISARAFAPGTISSTVAEATTSSPVITTLNAMPTSQPTVGTTGVSSTVTATTILSNSGSTSTASPTTNSISSSVATAANIVPSSSTVIPSTSSPLITTTISVKSASIAVDVTTQDVSSNTIDTSSVTDKQSLVNQTDVSNLVNPLSAGTNVSVADNSSMSSGLYVSPSLPDKNTLTTSTRIGTMEYMSRDGKLLRFEPNPLQIGMQAKIRNKDYFIFAVLPNNTILRKRPSMYPSKETPFLIYGVLPNNTLIQKFPNGTIVPMEPVIQVIGFDTRENPPPPPEIISNQVTSDQDSRPDNNKVSTGSGVLNTVSSLEANELSLNNRNGAPANTLPPLTEILGGRTVKAFNTIVNQTQGDVKVQTLQVDPLTNRVLLDKMFYSRNVIFRWKPVTRPNLTPVVPQLQSKVNVENVEINTISSASSSPPPPPTSAPSSTAKPVTTSASPSPTTLPPGPPSTEAPFTTPLPLTTAVPVTTTQIAITSPKITTRSPVITTLLPSTYPPGPPATNPTTLLPKVTSTTARIPSTTFLPTILTTLLSTLQPRKLVTTTLLPATISTTIPPFSTTVSTVSPDITTVLPLVTSTLTVPFTSPLSSEPVLSPNPLSALPEIDNGDLEKIPSPSLMDLLSNGAKISSTPLPTTVISSTVASLKNINLKQKKLTEQQKKDLETLEALEREQEAILKQLAFLTGLNLGAASPPKDKDNLADRVIEIAMKKVKDTDSVSTNSPPTFNLLETLSPKDSRQSTSIAAAPSVEEIVKQISANGLNSVTPAGPIVTSTYGKSSDALLASLLKEYGVGPSTPKVLSGAYEKEIRVTTRSPKITTTKRSVTTEAPGRIMQGLNWLLNALAPKPPSKPAQAKSKPKPKPANKDDELLSKQPTEITPVVVEAPDQPGEESKTENNVISQAQLVVLLKQLEEIQKDPKKAKDLDIEALKALQNIESSQKSGIQVIAGGSTGATARTFVTTANPKLAPTKPKGGETLYTSPLPLSVSNNIVEDIGGTSGSSSTIPPVNLQEVPGVAEDLAAATTKTKIPPVKLNPVPGVPDENPRIRGQLVNYAINVTKAISSFLGSAIQGAANSFQSMIGSGSRTAGNHRNSDSSNRAG